MTEPEQNGNGHPSPVDDAINSSPRSPVLPPYEFKAKNERRLDLIDQKYLGSGISPAEQAELDRLQTEVMEHIAATHPQPYIDGALLDELERRFAATSWT